jgi:hypothetical protein
MDVKLVKKFKVWGIPPPGGSTPCIFFSNKEKTVFVNKTIIQYKNFKMIVDTASHNLAKLSALFSYCKKRVFFCIAKLSLQRHAHVLQVQVQEQTSLLNKYLTW